MIVRPHCPHRREVGEKGGGRQGWVVTCVSGSVSCALPFSSTASSSCFFFQQWLPPSAVGAPPPPPPTCNTGRAGERAVFSPSFKVTMRRAEEEEEEEEEGGMGSWNGGGCRPSVRCCFLAGDQEEDGEKEALTHMHTRARLLRLRLRSFGWIGGDLGVQ